MNKSSDKSCKECERWEEHFYWNHLEEHKMHFFKVMVEDFTKCMSIPKKFVDNFNGQISNVVDLKTPNGDIWKIGVTKSQDNIFLQSGWTEFIAAHRIVENDLLFFTCNGNSSFEVAICDDSGCEKASPFFKKKDGRKTGEGDRPSFIVSAGIAPHGAIRAETRNEGNRRRKVIELCSSGSSSENDVEPKISRKSLCANNKTANRIDRDVASHGGASSGANEKHKVPLKRPRGRPRKYVESSKGVVEHVVKSESQESCKRKEETPGSAPYYSSRSLQLTPSQDKKVSKLARSLRPNPSFASVMYPSNAAIKNCFLNIPKCFAKAHLPRRSERITLQIPNTRQTWTCSYILATKLQGIYGGWNEFVRDNNLQKGDICLFEQMKDKKTLTFTVHII